MFLPFPFDLYLESFFAGALLTALTLPLWRKWCLHLGLVDDPGARKIHLQPIPLAGGLAVLTGFLVPLLAATVVYTRSHDLSAIFVYAFNRRVVQILAIVFGTVGMVLLGAIDDRTELSPKRKFAGQLFIALLTAATGIRITLFVPSELFSYIATVLWILTLTNALNFLDNMNGLCGGLGFIASFSCAWAAALKGQYLVALLAFQISGALLGFLPYNFPKAKVFLGDAGSHLVGYLVAVLAILPNYYSPELSHKWAVIAPLLFLAVPLFDLTSVVLIRRRLGKPFWLGDTNHISHRLVRNGLSQTLAVLSIWLASAILSALAFLFL
jgi:UDP-GlcNAc:undecaprenyl-phosphate/decaprenyl-phosphate GlcNAc-1-phosphate transferase